MSKVISKDGTSIAYSKTGNGSTVIIVDGALCSRAFGPTSKLAPLLANNFSVVNYDRRGRNESGDTTPYSVEREIEDIEALINETGSSAYIIGFSSGAALAFRAVASGLPIKKLAMYEAPYVMNMGGHNPPADTAAQLKQLIASGQRAAAIKFFMKDMVGLPGIIPFIMSLTPMWKKLKAVAHTIPYDAAILDGFTIPTALAAKINIPTLVLNGSKSPVSLKNASKKLAEAIPHAQSKSLEGQTHDVSMKAIAPELINFFKN